MKWDRVKSYLIILLLLVNVFFGFILIKQYYQTVYIGDNELTQLTAILNDSGIAVSESAIPARRLASDVYGGVYPDTYYEDITLRLSGSGESASYVTPDGMRYVLRETGAVFEFVYPFGIRFYQDSGDIPEISADSVITADDIAAMPGLERMSPLQVVAIKSIIDDYFDSSTDSGSGISIKTEITEVYSDTVSGADYVLMHQHIGGLPVYGFEAVAVVSGSNVIYLNGNLILSSLTESYNTELYDQVNLLLAEKSELTSVPGVVTDESGAHQDASASYTLDSADGCYCINWNYNRTKFYILPAWKFTYNNGAIIRIRNAVSSSNYAM